jgi:hypothetical protein
MTQSYQHKMHERNCYQPEHIWHQGPIPIHQDNFYTLHPYLHHKNFQIKKLQLFWILHNIINSKFKKYSTFQLLKILIFYDSMFNNQHLARIANSLKYESIWIKITEILHFWKTLMTIITNSNFQVSQKYHDEVKSWETKKIQNLTKKMIIIIRKKKT